MQTFLTLFFLLFSIVWAKPVWAELNIAIKKPFLQSIESIDAVDKSTTSIAYSLIEVATQAEHFVDLSDLIENEVGVQVRKFGAVGSYSTAVLRGASSQQVVVYLDGVAINSASIAAIDLSGIDINDIEYIEIYRGATPIELGQASMGGAINIISKKTRRKNPNQLKTSVGSFNTKQITINHNYKKNDDSVYVSADYLSSDNNYATIFDNNTEFNINDDREVRVNNDAVKKHSLSIKWDKNLNSYFMSTRLKIYNKKKQIPNKNNNDDVTTSFSTDNIELLSQYSWQSLFHKNLDLNIKLIFKNIEQRYEDSLSQVGFFPQDVIYKTKNNRIQALAKYKMSTSTLSLLMAIGNNDYQFNNLLSDDGLSLNQRKDIEFNMQHTSYWLNESLLISIALRYQDIKDKLAYAIDSFGFSAEQADKSYTILQPQIGVKYRIDAASSWLFNAGKYTRIPLFSELFGNQGLFRGNENLREENGLNIDVGLKYSWFKPSHWYHNAKIYIGLFHNQTDNLIVRISNSQGISVADNVSRATITGLEWDVSFKPTDHWDVDFSGTLMNPRAFSEKNDLNNKIIPGQYRQSYSLYASYKTHAWRFSMQHLLNKDIYWDSPNGRKGDDYYLLNLNVSKKWRQHLLSLEVKNALNEHYANFDRVWDRPGRSFFINYQYSI